MQAFDGAEAQMEINLVGGNGERHSLVSGNDDGRVYVTGAVTIDRLPDSDAGEKAVVAFIDVDFHNDVAGGAEFNLLDAPEKGRGLYSDCDVARKNEKTNWRKFESALSRCKLAKHYVNALNNVSKWYNDTMKGPNDPDLNFYANDPTMFEGILHAFGLKDFVDEVKVVGFDGTRPFIMKDEFSEEAVKDFATKLLQNKLKM